MPDLRQGCTTGKPSEDTAPADALVLFGAMGDPKNLKTGKRLLLEALCFSETGPPRFLVPHNGIGAAERKSGDSGLHTVALNYRRNGHLRR